VVALDTKRLVDAIDLFRTAKRLKVQRPDVAANSSYTRELLQTPYGEFLFAVDVATIDRLLVRCGSPVF
jgi:hypothetical protein